MIKTIQFLVLIICICIGSVYADSGKARIIGEFQKIQSQIFIIAKQNKDSEPKAQIINKIDKIISEKLSSEQLFRMGIATYVSGVPGMAGDSQIDNVFFFMHQIDVL